ncbi:MAG: DnaA regulatory inactivator Hda [Leptothrix sp. (in: Bacteria)]|nr:DnaA regulatory inactivator Hda [Leptothrix sp. (in: b-proteobacteria)]
MRQIPLDLGPVSMPGLDDFIAEEGAPLQALHWLQAWPSGPQAKVPAAYFWGPSGSGKTHLLRAMVPVALAQGHHVMWVSAQGCQMWDAELPEAPTLALIDDCERLDTHLQHLAFNLFIESASASEVAGPLSIMAAGSVPPVDLPVRDDLRTRLGWGLVFALSPLSETGVRKALQGEASRRGIELDEGVVSYLLVRYNRDLGFLMGLLDRLDRFALAEHRTVTVPLLKQMLVLETE